MDPITKMKALKSKMQDCLERIEELEDTDFGGLSFLDCERQLNDALGHHGDVSWRDMIREVETLKAAR